MLRFFTFCAVRIFVKFHFQFSADLFLLCPIEGLLFLRSVEELYALITEDDVETASVAEKANP